MFSQVSELKHLCTCVLVTKYCGVVRMDENCGGFVWRATSTPSAINSNFITKKDRTNFQFRRIRNHIITNILNKLMLMAEIFVSLQNSPHYLR